jgi:hypothetical protein
MVTADVPRAIVDRMCSGLATLVLAYGEAACPPSASAQNPRDLFLQAHARYRLNPCVRRHGVASATYGRCSARSSARATSPVTSRWEWKAAPEAYAQFQQKPDGTVEVLRQPGATT